MYAWLPTLGRMSETAGSGQLSDLADALADLADLEARPLEYDAEGATDDEWIDPRGTDYWHVWNDVAETVRSYFAPLNYVREPESGLERAEKAESRCLELITVSPQDDPQVRLRVIYWASGQLDARAEFINPVEDGWESFFNGNLAEFDAERARNDLRFITDGLARTSELERETVLSEREAQVQALRECDYDADEIADVLGLTDDTVVAVTGEIERRLEQSRRTLDLIDLA